ncbi:uncharacterized protein LOC141857488 [Brevipalpus obovatus]|uniref:uncharacterized protein LOC141857488 n=1 Tax=Brevipalpus obovatus TaxID=246614 RepID=UPI003D9EE037
MVTIPPSNSAQASRIKDLTGLAPEAFDDLLTHLSRFKNPRQSLRALLHHYKTGLAMKNVALLFGINDKTFSRQAKKMRQQLYDNFVPLNLGFEHLDNRDLTSSHNTLMADRFFLSDEQRARRAKITIWDGTYIRMQKSMNVAVQKMTFSGQKKTNLFKPMVCCFPDGYIYEVFTYHGGSVNDATIMRGVMNQNPSFNQVFKPGDMFIFDRGFRDVVAEMQRKGFHVHTPASSVAGEKPSWEKANRTRLVTKVRCVIEAINERIKNWKLLHHVLQNTVIGSKNQDLKIICALINKYGKRLVSDVDHQEMIANRILE